MNINLPRQQTVGPITVSPLDPGNLRSYIRSGQFSRPRGGREKDTPTEIGPILLRNVS